MAHPLSALAQKALHARQSSAKLETSTNPKRAPIVKESSPVTTFSAPNINKSSRMQDSSVMPDGVSTPKAKRSTKASRIPQDSNPDSLDPGNFQEHFAKGGRAGKKFQPKEEGRMPSLDAPEAELPPNPEQSPALNPNPGGSRMPYANPPQRAPAPLKPPIDNASDDGYGGYDFTTHGAQEGPGGPHPGSGASDEGPIPWDFATEGEAIPGLFAIAKRWGPIGLAASLAAAAPKAIQTLSGAAENRLGQQDKSDMDQAEAYQGAKTKQMIEAGRFNRGEPPHDPDALTAIRYIQELKKNFGNQ